MAVADINKVKTDTVLRSELPQDVSGIVTSADTQSQTYSGIPPLISHTLQLSPQLGESSRQLTRHAIDRGSWSSTLRNVHLPLVSGAFSYILQRAVSIPSMIYRKLDLPWFGKQNNARGVPTQSSETFPDSLRDSINPSINGEDVYTYIPPSIDVVERNYPSQAADTAYPAILRNMASTATLENESIHKIPASPILHPETVLPLINRQIYGDYQSETANIDDTFIKNQGKSPVSDISRALHNRRLADKRDSTIGKTPADIGQLSHLARRISAGPVLSATSHGTENTQSKPVATVRNSPDAIDSEKTDAADDNRSESAKISKRSFSVKPDLVSRQKIPELYKNTPVDVAQSTTPETLGRPTQSSPIESSHQGIAASDKVALNHDTVSRYDSPNINSTIIDTTNTISIPQTSVPTDKQAMKSSPVHETEMPVGGTDNYNNSPPDVMFTERAIHPINNREIRTQITDNTVTDKAGQTLNADRFTTIDKPLLKPLSVQINKSSEDIIAGHDTNSSPVKEAEKSLSSSSKTRTNNIIEQDAGNNDTAIFRKAGQRPVSPTRDISVKNELKTLTSQQKGSLISRQVISEALDGEGQHSISEPEIYQSENRTRYASDVMSAEQQVDGNTYDTYLPSTIIYNNIGTNKNSLNSNINESLLNSRTHTLDSPAIQMYPFVQRLSSRLTSTTRSILQSSIGRPVSEAQEKGPYGTDDIAFPSNDRYSGQQLHDLPVVSLSHNKGESERNTSPVISRSISDKLAGLDYLDVWGNPERAASPASGTPESVTGQEVVNQLQDEDKSEKEANVDIRAVADKVYTLLKHDLKIERERNRYRLLR